MSRQWVGPSALGELDGRNPGAAPQAGMGRAFGAYRVAARHPTHRMRQRRDGWGTRPRDSLSMSMSSPSRGELSRNPTTSLRSKRPQAGVPSITGLGTSQTSPNKHEADVHTKKRILLHSLRKARSRHIAIVSSMISLSLLQSACLLGSPHRWGRFQCQVSFVYPHWQPELDVLPKPSLTLVRAQGIGGGGGGAFGVDLLRGDEAVAEGEGGRGE